MTTLRLVGGRDAPSPAPDPTDLFPSPLSAAILGDLLAAVPENVAAEALASLGPRALGLIVDKALVQLLLGHGLEAHLDHAVHVGRALGELCDTLDAARRAAPARRRPL